MRSVSDGGAGVALAYVLMSTITSRMGMQAGAYGAEMRAARETAEAVGAQIVLGKPA